MEQPRRRGILSARDRAERWVLGTLLLDPTKWHRVQTLLAPEDFTEPRRRRLAEVYWNHQRDEGEPAFNEFLSLLDQNGPLGANALLAGPDGEPQSQTDTAAGITEGDGELSGAGLRELAIEVTDEIDVLSAAQSNPEDTLRAAIEHLQRNREAQEKQKLIAALRRSSEQNMGAAQEADLLVQLQDQVRQASKPPPTKG